VKTESENRICAVCDGGPGNEGNCLCGAEAWENPEPFSPPKLRPGKSWGRWGHPDPRPFVERADWTAIQLGLAELTNTCHGASVRAGWWHDPKTGRPVGSVPEKMMLIVSEISEAMEADRKSLRDDKLPDRGGVEVELADAVIRIFDLAGALGLDLPNAIHEKMMFNTTRPDHSIEARKSSNGKAY
jgi:NTP pyrophosphatase (non-canonical NTP hydrolase)